MQGLPEAVDVVFIGDAADVRDADQRLGAPDEGGAGRLGPTVGQV